MDPEKDLLDIPTELEIPVEEEKKEEVEAVLNESTSAEIDNIVNDSNVEVNLNDESNNVNVVQSVDSSVTSVDVVPEELNVSETLDVPSSGEVSNEQIVDNQIMPEAVQPMEGLQPSLNTETNNIEQPVVDAQTNNDGLEVEPLNGANVSQVVDNAVLQEDAVQPVEGVQSNNQLVLDPSLSQTDVQQPSLVIEPALSSDNLANSVVETTTNTNQQPVSVSTQTVPTIQPLDSTNPPEELQITVDKDPKAKKNPKRKKKFKLGALIVVLLIMGLSFIVFSYILPMFLNKKSESSDTKVSSLYVLQVDYKDSIDAAYPFLKIQEQENVTGTYGTYSIENDGLAVTKSDGNKFTVSFEGLYFTSVNFFGNINNKDYLKLSDDFSNNYIYAIGEISENQTIKYDDNDLLMIPSTVDVSSVEIGSYIDGRGTFFAVRNGDSISLIVKKDSKTSLERLTGSIMNGQDVSILDLDINKDLLDKVNVNGFIFEYTGGVSVYSKTDDDTSVYPLNDAEEKAYVAKTVYLVVSNDEQKIELYIFFDKDSKEYLNVVNLTDSDFANGNENLSDYSSPVKNKEISNEKLLVTFEDGSKIEK